MVVRLLWVIFNVGIAVARVLWVVPIDIAIFWVVVNVVARVLLVVAR